VKHDFTPVYQFSVSESLGMNPSIAAIMTKKSESTAGLRKGQSAIE
jgi:hypothetical protein